MIKLILCIFSIDYKDGLEYIMSTSKVQVKLPYLENNPNISIQENLKTLIETYIKVDTNWLKLKIFDIINKDGSTEIYYLGRIPYEYKHMTKDIFLVRPELSDDPTLMKMKYFI